MIPTANNASDLFNAIRPPVY